MKYFKLNDGNQMPANGFGTFQIPDNNQCAKAVTDAIDVGYQLIDTAEGYHNEDMVGKGIKDVNVTRDKLFIVSKLWVSHYGYAKTKQAIDDTLNQLGLDYLDLFLIHQPFGDYYGSWHAMEEAQKAGKIKSIGVSNFSSRQLIDLIQFNDVKPAVNQIEINPWQQRNNSVQVLKDINVQPEAWAPFAEGQRHIFTNPTLKEIADKHHKTVGQVILRWELQRGIVSLAKSIHKSRIKENFNIYDFNLTPQDMQSISEMNRHKGILENAMGNPFSSNPKVIKQYTSFIKSLSRFN